MDRIPITVVRVSQGFLDKATKTKARVGVYMPTGAVAIRSDLTGALLADTIRHEKCHKVMGEWHPGD